MESTDNKLVKVLEWVVDIDPPAIVASVKAEKEKYPQATQKDLAKKAFSASRWKAASCGFATGLPANPWVAVPAATTDIAITLRMEVAAVARAAVIYDENFFDDEEAK